MLTHLGPADAGLIISVLCSALVSVVLFTVWLIKRALDDKDARIHTLEGQISGALAQIADNGEAIVRSMDAQLGIAREQRLIEEMKARLTLPAPDDAAPKR